MGYYKVLIQKETAEGEKDAAVKDTVADFGVWCSELPLDVGLEVKEPVTRDWRDEDGEDAYTDGGLYVAAYDMTVKWLAKGAAGTVRDMVRAFIDYLSGRDGSGVKMRIYSEWSGMGRQHVRLKKVDSSAKLDRCGDFEVVSFDTTLRVEDPVTQTVLVATSEKQ